MARTKKSDQTKNDGKTAQDAAQEQEAAGQDQVVEKPEATEQDQGVPKEQETTNEKTSEEDTAAIEEAASGVKPETGESGETEEAGQEPDMFANLPNPCVYCGPSVKGVARQYTTYQGGIPDALREFIRKHPVGLGLIVSTGKFTDMRRRLEKYGTKEAELYRAVKAEL